MINTKKIEALITLLDDPNEVVFQSVSDALLKEPIEVIPELEKAWELSKDEVFQLRIESIVHSLQINDLTNELKRWLEDEKRDFLYGVYLVCRYQYPDLKLAVIKEQLASLRKEIWLGLKDNLTSLEKIRVVNHVLFDVHKFTRNSSHFLSPANNFISEVLNTTKGNPITLSVIYSLLCLELGIPVYGVNLPKNFILAFLEGEVQPGFNDPSPDAAVLFYVNPINKGAVLGKREIEYFIKQQKLELNENYFLPCNSRVIVRRMLSNLLFSYDSSGDDLKRDEVTKLLTLFDFESDY